MITEEMMMTTEMLLMSYYFDMSEWLKGVKTVISIRRKLKENVLKSVRHKELPLQKPRVNIRDVGHCFQLMTADCSMLLAYFFLESQIEMLQN